MVAFASLTYVSFIHYKAFMSTHTYFSHGFTLLILCLTLQEGASEQVAVGASVLPRINPPHSFPSSLSGISSFLWNTIDPVITEHFAREEQSALEREMVQSSFCIMSRKVQRKPA